MITDSTLFIRLCYITYVLHGTLVLFIAFWRKYWLSAPSSGHQFKTSTKKNSQFRQFYREVGNSKLGKLEIDVACKYFVYSNRNEKMCDFESDAQNHKFCEFLIRKREF